VSAPRSGHSPVATATAGFFGEAAAWCQGRWWQWRLPVLVWLAWDGQRHLRDPEAGGLFAGITFGVHELGHLVFAFFGEFMTVLGGSLMQLLIPVAAGALLYHHRDFFGLAAAGAWLASSLMDLARYIGDARSFDLDLLSFGEGGQHDWAWLLGHTGFLPYDTRIAAFTRGAAAVALTVSVLFGVWLCIKMWRAGRQAGLSASP
jgi:hypothetical protein